MCNFGFLCTVFYRFLLCVYSDCYSFSAALACNWLLSVVRHFNIIMVVTVLTLLAFFSGKCDCSPLLGFFDTSNQLLPR